MPTDSGLAPHVIRASGTNAKSPSQAGGNGGNISLTLTRQGESVFVSGTHTAVITPQQKLDLDAQGGNGADGVIGSDGKDGKNGAYGSEPTYHGNKSVMHGKPGIDGGDSQEGTNGSNPGNGGNISIRTKKDSLELFSLVWRTNVSPGRSGLAGRHGYPGRGGIGGQGAGGYVAGTGVVPHGNPGANGRSGKAPGTPLFPGNEGRPGTCSYQVLDTNGVVVTYSNPYRLELSLISLQTTTGSIEFKRGDTIEAKFDIINSGDMPSPLSSCNLIVTGKHVKQTQAGTCPGDIQPGKYMPCASNIQFQVTKKATRSRPLEIEIFAENPLTKTPYPGSLTKLSFFVQSRTKANEIPEQPMPSSP